MYERKCEWGMMGRQPGEPRTAVQSNAGLTPSKGEKGGKRKLYGNLLDHTEFYRILEPNSSSEESLVYWKWASLSKAVVMSHWLGIVGAKC